MRSLSNTRCQSKTYLQTETMLGRRGTNKIESSVSYILTVTDRCNNRFAAIAFLLLENAFYFRTHGRGQSACRGAKHHQMRSNHLYTNKLHLIAAVRYTAHRYVSISIPISMV